MIWTEAASKAQSLYDTVAGWVSVNPVETDLIIVAVVAGSLSLYTKRARRMRRRAHRLMWGVLMNRRDRAKYHAMMLEDAILDRCMEMVNAGDMTPEEEKKKLSQMAKSFDLTGLLPGKDQASVKRGINYRLLLGWWKKKPKIPGAPEVSVDPNYKPEFVVARKGLNSSKYASEAS